MRAIEIREPGGPDVLTLVERPRPEPAAGELLIAVEAAGVNRPDCLQRRGAYPPPPGASDLPGLEVAGTVTACGGGTESWSVGDKVCALLAGGGYAGFATAPVEQCLPWPAGFSAVQSAALPETCFTVWTNLFKRGALQHSESVLIHGGASGIGTTAVQMARAAGATVFATAGSDEKCALIESLGAECAINYREENFLDAIQGLTNDRGVDVILDIVGGRYLADNQKLLALDGRLVLVGVLGGAKAELNLGRVLTGRQTITGSTLRAQDTAAKGRIAAELLETVWPQLSRGEWSPVIQQTFPLEHAAAAHELLESNAARGKIVLTVAEADSA